MVIIKMESVFFLSFLPGGNSALVSVGRAASANLLPS
jgi:hypothetical protein